MIFLIARFFAILPLVVAGVIWPVPILKFNSNFSVRSVRRTSLREKQMAAKADARGEARLRETFDSVVDDDMQVGVCVCVCVREK